MTQQSLELDSETYDSDRYMAPGLGYVYFSQLSSNLNWEAGVTYYQRQFGYEDSKLTMPIFNIPFGLRYAIGNFAIGAGAYYWMSAGDIDSDSNGSGSFSDEGYKENGNGAYWHVSIKLGAKSFIELRNNFDLSDASDTSDVSVKFSDYQIAYGYVIGFGGGAEVSSSDSGGGEVSVE